MIPNRYFFCRLALIALISIVSDGTTFSQSHSKKSPSLEIQFEHYVGNDLLQLDSAHYTNALGQAFTVTKFNYYISGIRLKRKDGKEFVSSAYFLIKEEDELSKRIPLHKIPPGEYTSIQFTIGVDSATNCGGIQTGALDPIHGMFWTWNTGYIFLKLEGKSTASQLPDGFLEYHIGGFRAPGNCIRTVTLSLAEPLIISHKKMSHLTIKADVLEILQTPVAIDFSSIPAVTAIENAQIICNNYMDIFSIKP